MYSVHGVSIRYTMNFSMVERTDMIWILGHTLKNCLLLYRIYQLIVEYSTMTWSFDCTKFKLYKKYVRGTLPGLLKKWLKR